MCDVRRGLDMESSLGLIYSQGDSPDEVADRVNRLLITVGYPRRVQWDVPGIKA